MVTIISKLVFLIWCDLILALMALSRFISILFLLPFHNLLAMMMFIQIKAMLGMTCCIRKKPTIITLLGR